MDGEPKKSGWKIWLYMTPLYLLVAVPLVKWTMKVNSGDVAISKDDYGAFNSAEGEIKKTDRKDYDPGLSDIGYSVRYRSGKEGAVESAPRAPDNAGSEEAEAAKKAAAAAAAAKKPAAPQAQGRAYSANQTALESKDTNTKSQMGFGAQKGYLTYAVGKAMGNPKAVGALMNNSWVVKGFMGRDTVRSALGSKEGLQNYLSNGKNVSNFLGNPVVQAAMNNPSVVAAFASSGMANAILASPAVKSMLEDPQSVTTMMATNPELMQVLSNPNVMNALVSNPQTAGLAASLGGGARK